ncbi:NAD(P)/FAD-dependent oxidoreductase [Chelatococcus asaccharovorans]|uniref:Glycine/D-amino acid oxidase-like deaminating enzyme n=1 Tax=Chelatococcus asaccharovorans TaxID=28210 RepID=A0A2V3TYM8_9HYPH|nr:FAD-dependent oxidoreductase [Chelatococcus asaccharovorans]MBS7706799.1 FAD-binding oxidoreductase [Chelatococcus asaccharovorans]PXW54055.1 glycine/D-amino acid oxidase-like deaminating enzyme [Chelatococcus asaccharovorans]
MATDRPPPGRRALVLGAGIVGVSVALHLQQRGWSVILADRKAPGRETSYGNAGLIESSAVLPHPFPRGLSTLLTLATNRSAALRYDPRVLPQIASWLLAYWRASRDGALAHIGPAFRTLIGAALAEHEALMAQVGATGLLRREGWLELCRSPQQLDDADREAALARSHGITAERIEQDALYALQPVLRPGLSGAIAWRDTGWIVDPGGLVEAYAALFTNRGGRILRADALALTGEAGGWQIRSEREEVVVADHAVVALGPWTGDLATRLGYRFPLAVKRGYHRHFAHNEGCRLTQPVYVRDEACLMVPMTRGVRLLSGVELAARDAPPSPVQLQQIETSARSMLPLGDPIEPAPWLGARPCLPDMLPVIGPAPRHPGLWFAFGHSHYGLTLGPVTGRMLAEMMSGETPFISPQAYRAERFAA